MEWCVYIHSYATEFCVDMMRKIIALILLDPPVGEYFYMGSGAKRKLRFMPSSPYRGGFVDFSPQVKSTLEFDNVTAGPERVSALDDLCYYWTHSELAHGLNFDTPAAATIFLKRYVASHWMVLLQYSHDLLHRHEHTVNRASKVTDISASALEHCWTGVQYLNNRTSGWYEYIDSSIHQFTITGTLGDFPGEPENNTAEDDFIRLGHGLRGLKEEIKTVTSSITGLLSIYEAKRTKELTNLAMLFLPLAFTSGIFGMSDNYAPGGSSFWVYWVVAGPLVFLMFLTVFGLNSGTALANLWLLKTRLFKLSLAEKFPPKLSSDSV
jgi:CorA-like Mg2+ transporter protein